MDIQAIATSRLEWTGDLLAIGCYEDAVELTGDLGELNTKYQDVIAALIAETEFKGAVGTSAVTRVGVNTPIKKIALIGLGKADKLKLDSLRKAAAAIARTAKKEKAKTLGISLPVWNNDGAATTGAIAEGVILALHEDSSFKSATEEKDKKW